MAAPANTFGAGRLFLGDSRVLLLLLNDVRHRGLHHVFGTTRDQENLLTFVLALAALDAAYAGVRHVIPASLGLSNAAMGGWVAREGAFAVGGPGSREVPHFAGLLAIAVAGGAALPAARRALAGIRAMERRVRAQRIARYRAAMRVSDLAV